MRCFQHFILHCYPHHPLGNESVWTHEVPCLSRDVSALATPPTSSASVDFKRNSTRT